MTSEPPRPDAHAGAGVHRRGPRSLPVESVRRLFTRTVTGSLHLLRGVPPLPWWRRHVHAGLELSTTEVELARGDRDLDGLTLAFVSDVHAGFYTDAEDLRALGDRLAAAAPDLVVLGGDLLATHRSDLQLYDDLLERLAPPLGTIAIAGNHDVVYLRRKIVPLRDYLAEHGVRVLMNEGLRVERGDATFWVAGVDDYSEGMPDLPAALVGRRPEEPVVLLSHHPDFFVEASRTDIDLQLSGHTHGGQIRLFGWAPISHSKHGFVEGSFRRDGSTLVVGRGVGFSFLPIRIGARPEVPLVRLRRS